MVDKLNYHHRGGHLEADTPSLGCRQPESTYVHKIPSNPYYYVNYYDGSTFAYLSERWPVGVARNPSGQTPRNMLPPERAAHRSASAIFKRISLRSYSTYSLKNVSRPPSTTASLEMVLESPTSSDTESQSVTESEKSEAVLGDELMRTPPPRAKSNSIAGSMLAPPKVHKRRRPSFLHLQVGPNEHEGPHSASAHLNVPRFTVTAPPGEQHRRFSHGFAFHGFALRRHSNTSLHRSESMVSLACFRTLSQLVNSDNLAELQQYIANNKNVCIDDKDENGTTALMCASENGRLAAVRMLLGAGADATAADADGWTPLGMLELLLTLGTVVVGHRCYGHPTRGMKKSWHCCWRKGADVHAHGNYNINSLVWAAGRKHSGVVQRLLAAGARPNSCDKYATSALTWAARAGDVTSCAALLRAGADANTAGMYCWTPLLQATHGNHFEIVQMLLEHKPNVNALDKDGYTALAIACKEGYYDIALALINSGAYINVQDQSKDTPLIHAVKAGHKNIVEALLKKHVDVDLPGKEKKTPVYTATEKGHVAILKLLLASNPDLEHSTVSGDTPLMRAVRSRNAEMVQLLLERKARVNVADIRGDTALHIAMRARSKQIVEILLRNPKNSQLLYKPNKLNETPYNIDMSYNKTILGQIFGARKLNTNEDNENMLGYELYSAALADMLSEPSLSVPITVGLYARWGSGKSFLLNKLKEEMKNFARQWSETGWAWSWAVWWGAWHVALSAAAVAAVAGAPPYWWWAGGVLSALGRKFSSLLLALQVVFCHPPGPNDPRALPATPIRFHFTEGMKSGGGQEGEAMVVQMIASLGEALECQYGRICTRLARAFRPKPVSSTSGWKWRRVCCIPHILTFELCFTCIIVGFCVLIMYLTDRDPDPQRREIQQGLMLAACAVSGAALLANLYTCARLLAALLRAPRARLARAAARNPAGLRPEVQALTHVVSCLDAFTGQQTRLVVVVDALDSCEQEKVLALLNAVHALCSDPKSPFILLLAIDPHIISKAVEINSRRAFCESNIGGWDYLRNMVQLPFYLQNSALRRVKTAQQTAARRMQVIMADDFSSSLQRSVSARRLSSTSELMSSQERIKGQAARERRLRPSESVASSVASGLHRGATGGVGGAGAADLNRVLLTDDYFSDVNPRSMRRLMNVLYVTGRLLKAFQIEFNWYQLASWVNLTEQWPFRTSWIIYHHETYEEHIDDSTSLKHIYEKVKPLMSGLREASTLMELDRDERKLEVFLSFHRATLTAADLKIFLPFTINLDPYIKKLIKEEQMQSGVEEDAGAGGAAAGLAWGQPHTRQPHSKLFPRKHPAAPGPVPAQQMWVGWANTSGGFVPQAINSQPFPAPHYQQPPPQAPAQQQPSQQPSQNPFQLLKTAFPGLILELSFGDWELFKLLIINLRELEANMPTTVPTVAVMSEKSAEAEIDAAKPPRHTLETQRSRPSNVEKQPYAEYQVTLEEQMICGALQTLNEEALEDVLQSEPPSHPDEESVLQLRVGASSVCGTPAGSPRPLRRDPSILKGGGSFRARRVTGEPPAVTFNVEHEDDSDSDGQITDKIMSRGGGSRERSPARDEPSDDESAPLVSPGCAPVPIPAAVGSPGPPSEASTLAGAADNGSASLSPRSDVTELESPRDVGAAFDLLPGDKRADDRATRPAARLDHAASSASLGDMVEPYNMRLLGEAGRGLWRQDALDAGPPWPWDEPDSAV
ncbi:hypothetical protein HW555_002266 [Spodoptera exigua]|uniref:KAP NTPase domain-containing protein n=1 Tax=Spodoptera exigua TaxID=7107 RepID=A0A835GQE8_SPOEX|nr:hypothetical protein HW555_002266 [Spodoptera exigua]